MKIITLYSLLTILSLMGAFTELSAQHTIQGTVTDTRQEALSYAVLRILDARDSAVLQTAMPDSSGQYRFKLATTGDKLISVSCVGFREETKRIEETTGTEQTIDFLLHESKTALEEVTIAAGKPMLERKPDRIIFNVGSSITAMGGNALDALKKAPGVWVRQQDNSINLIGKSGVQVMINDRLQQLSGEDLMALLQSILSDNIDRIEVITAPPARYDAAGNAGFVNIVLKKNNKKGINGSLRAGYEQASYSKGIAGADLNYRQGKLNLYANGSYSNGANAIVERLNTLYPGQLFEVADHYKRILKPLQYTWGADYELHRNGVLGLQFTSSSMNRVNEGNTGILVKQWPGGMPDSSMRTLGYSTSRNNNNLLNVNYAWTLDTSGTKLSLNVNRLWFDGRRNNDFGTTGYTGDFGTPTGTESRNKTEGVQRIRITTAQADMSVPYSLATLSFGGKLSYISNFSDNHFRYLDGDRYYEDPAISNAFDYSEKVQALYVSAEKTIDRWSFQAGLRGEFTQTKGYSRNLDQTNTNHYFNLFPTAYLQYQPNEDHAWVLNYSRRINRPDYRSLDPYRAYATPYHYNEGNPFLLPSFNNNIELSYTFKTRYIFSAFYQYEENHFGSVWLVDPVRNVTSGYSKNFADFRAYGINASASLAPFTWWEMQVQLSGQVQQLQSREYTAVQQSYSLPLYYASVNNSFSLNKSKTLLAEANFFYLSKYREDFLEINPIGSIDAGIKALFMDKKLVVGLNGSDILASQKARGVHVVTGQTINNYFDTRNVRLSASYKFGNNKLKARRERSTGIEEEKGRAGQ